MGINLAKGQSVALSIMKFRLGFILDSTPDISAFMLGVNKKLLTNEYLVFYNSSLRVRQPFAKVLEALTETKFSPSSEIYNSSGYEHWRINTLPVDPDFSVFGTDESPRHPGGDDKTMYLDLNKVSTLVHEIIITLTITKADEQNKNFGNFHNSSVRVCSTEIYKDEFLKFELQDDFLSETAIEFCRFFRSDDEWRFEALGLGLNGGIQYLVNKYV
jgi:tellurium resistance protein TerD